MKKQKQSESRKQRRSEGKSVPINGGAPGPKTIRLEKRNAYICPKCKKDFPDRLHR